MVDCYQHGQEPQAASQEIPNSKHQNPNKFQNQKSKIKNQKSSNPQILKSPNPTHTLPMP